MPSGQGKPHGSHSPSARPHGLPGDTPKGAGLTLEGESGPVLSSVHLEEPRTPTGEKEL